MITPVYQRKHRRVSRWKHRIAVLLLPFTAIALIPAAILFATGDPSPRWAFDAHAHFVAVGIGSVLVMFGLLVLSRTIVLFRKRGFGTIAPWDPPRRLVVRGVYGHVRNPMIGAIVLILLGEALILGAPELLLWVGAFIAGNALYVPLKEERDLQERFGEAYEIYRKNVPRWIPQRRKWRPGSEEEVQSSIRPIPESKQPNASLQL